MQAKYITAVKCLDIAGNLGRGDRIADGIFITNDQTVIANLIPKEYIPVIGVLEWSFIKDAKAVVWSAISFEKTQDPIHVLISIMYKVHGFLNSIWLFGDNSIDTEMSFLLYDDNGIPTASSSYLSIATQTANGKSSTISLTREQLQEVRKFHREHITTETFGAHRATKVLKHENRVTRALYFVLAARGSVDLGIKIAHYCTALETLFSTSQAELSHQLSERLAHFIERQPNKRIEIYRIMKRAYAFRSKMVHGSALSPKDFDDLSTLSVACDNFLRRSVQEIFCNDDTEKMFGTEARLDEYFTELIFGLQKETGHVGTS